MRLVIRSFGWLFIAVGVTIALYLVYTLYWTGLSTQRAQAALLDDWELEVGDIGSTTGADGEPGNAEAAPPEPVEVGEAVAALQFHRPGSTEVPVHAEPLLIVEGVDLETLKTGPGHYPGTALPGEMGNFAIAGHRTTSGAPFYDLDRLQQGDEVHVTDRTGHRWVYEVISLSVVAPTDDQVLRRDPFDLGRPMLTLTTCHPRWSNRERLIVHAQLVDEQLPLVAA